MKQTPLPPPPFSRPPAAGDLPPRLHFTPVPRLRIRRKGWSEERQRAFILALSLCGSVGRAARAVGMSARSAYRLLDADGADSFAKAWDLAIDVGVERVRIAALDRAIHGRTVAIFRRGKLDRIEHRANDRLAIALLSGRARPRDLERGSVESRRAHRQDLRVLDSARAADGGNGACVDAAMHFLVGRLEEEASGRRVERTGREQPWTASPNAPAGPDEEASPQPPRRNPRILRL